MTVKFSGPAASWRRIRSGPCLTLGDVSVQDFKGGSAQNEVAIGTELKEERQLNVNRQQMETILATTFGQPGNGKPDFGNNTGEDTLAQRLQGAPGRGGCAHQPAAVAKAGARHPCFRELELLGIDQRILINCLPCRE